MHPALAIFEKLTTIPHGSGNEKQISDFIADYAKSRGLKVVQDSAWNIYIQVPGTKGFEDSAPILLQGHMDMVCEKAVDSKHDFTKDPLPLVYDGDILRTDGTTLGADNGVAIAYCLALLDDPAPHPPLEMLFTVEEETGMKGARAFDPASFKSRTLINLDSSGEGEITVGCAGGASVHYQSTLPRTTFSGNTYTLTVDGLSGGHSGAEIHTERGNANKILCRILRKLLDTADVGVASIRGGSKTNAIPLFAQAQLVTKDDLSHAVQEWNHILQTEYRFSDPNVRVTLASSSQKISSVFESKALQNLLAAIALTPCGPVHRNPELDVVLASNSIGIIETHEDTVTVKNAMRANLESLLDELVYTIQLIAKTFNLNTVVGTRYPSWAFQTHSKLQNVAKEAYHALYQKDPSFLIIHAGLEVGYIAEKLPNLDAISIGPNMAGIHTIYERLNIPSFAATYDYLLEILRRLK